MHFILFQHWCTWCIDICGTHVDRWLANCCSSRICRSLPCKSNCSCGKSGRSFCSWCMPCSCLQCMNNRKRRRLESLFPTPKTTSWPPRLRHEIYAHCTNLCPVLFVLNLSDIFSAIFSGYPLWYQSCLKEIMIRFQLLVSYWYKKCSIV